MRFSSLSPTVVVILSVLLLSAVAMTNVHRWPSGSLRDKVLLALSQRDAEAIFRAADDTPYEYIVWNPGLDREMARARKDLGGDTTLQPDVDRLKSLVNDSDYFEVLLIHKVQGKWALLAETHEEAVYNNDTGEEVLFLGTSYVLGEPGTFMECTTASYESNRVGRCRSHFIRDWWLYREWMTPSQNP